ncbi:hypothetical protein [Pedobacter sp. KLB.chiD]|uniref:hypothetical protein n=1 Tax=Pedobacter sp. KLB.chiD TaxID=3387402 RepID=UPI00399A1217
MNYAATYHHRAAEAKANRLAQSVGKLRQLDKKTERCKPNKKRQAKGSPSEHAANGIIGMRFSPKLCGATIVETRKRPLEIERDLKQSLSQLARHYSIELKPLEGYDFPYNIATALANLTEKINNIEHCESIHIMHDQGKSFFATCERYSNNCTIYYIPVVPLYWLYRERKENAVVLFSVFGYLYQIVDVPYYRDESSYLFWQYDMLQDWIFFDDDEETDCRDVYSKEFKVAKYAGDLIKKKITKSENLTYFKQRIDALIPKNEFDLQCMEVAKEAYALYSDFPASNIYRNLPPDQDEDPDLILRMDQYISFYSDSVGLVSDQLWDTINCEFNECGAIEEPTIINKFNGKHCTSNLDFEKRVFSMIDKLTYLLNNIKKLLL